MFLRLVTATYMVIFTALPTKCECYYSFSVMQLVDPEGVTFRFISVHTSCEFNFNFENVPLICCKFIEAMLVLSHSLLEAKLSIFTYFLVH